MSQPSPASTNEALPRTILADRIEQALIKAFGEDLRGTDPVLRTSDHADFQANVALSLKKRLGKNPREIADQILANLDVAGVCEKVDIAGPGFINFKLETSFIAQCATRMTARAVGNLQGAELIGKAEKPETVVIDYSAPNIAKEMHVGHLRSTIIGDSLARVLEALGHTVIRQNHVGDWGTQFGMLIEHLTDIGQENADHDLTELVDIYRAARKKFDEDPSFADRSRKRVVSLQSGDPKTLELWAKMTATSKKHLNENYAKLHIKLTDKDIAGESFYNDKLTPTVTELEEKGLARVDQGALCVFPPGFKGRDGSPLPLIVRKQDGGYGYATTDLTAIRYRLLTLKATRIIYVVGAPQGQHFSMVFKAAEEAKWLAPPARAEHAAFGSILGKDGKMFRTRAGEGQVRLMDLLTEGEEQALRIVKEKAAERAEGGDEELSADEQRTIANAIAIAAIKYADLSSDRIKDYVFDWDRMLAAEGKTGPYLQYAQARIQSIKRKAAALGATIPAEVAPITLPSPEERALALTLFRFGEVVREVESALEPHRLCTYLYELAQAFSAFFHKCPVIKVEEPLRTSRLQLCELTGTVLRVGLDLLGIEAPARM